MNGQIGMAPFCGGFPLPSRFASESVRYVLLLPAST